MFGTNPNWILVNMAPLIFLILSFGLLYGVNKRFYKNKISFQLLGLIPVSLLLILAGAAHFFVNAMMMEMMPDILPYKRELVYITGVFEFLAAIGLMLESWRKTTSIFLLIFLLAVLPANIVGAMKHLPAPGMERGISYLYFRIPLQFIFMGWVYYFGVFKTDSNASAHSYKLVDN